MDKIYRAGLIPYIYNANGDIEMMFMKPSNTEYGGNKFQIAKGKIEKGESKLDAAIREASEELGFTKLNAKTAIKNLGNFLGRTEIFVVEVKSKDMFTKPHFETQSTTWLTHKQFNEIGRELHRPIIKAAIRFINKDI